MYGRGKTPAAPACDAVTREGRRCLRIGAASNFFFFFVSWLAPTRFRLEQIRAKSGRFVLNQVDSRQLGLYQFVLSETAETPIQAEIKKKKICKTAAQWSVIIRESPFFRDNTIDLLLDLVWLPRNDSRRASHFGRGGLAPQEPTTSNNTTATLLALDKVSCNIKRLWLPQNALCFVFYWTT